MINSELAHNSLKWYLCYISFVARLQTILNEEMTCTAMRTLIKFNEGSDSANTNSIETHICEIIARLV